MLPVANNEIQQHTSQELIWIILSLDSRWTSREILETAFRLWSGCSCKANVDPQMLKRQNTYM